MFYSSQPRHLDLLMPAHNEAAGIERSLDSAAQALTEFGSDTLCATITVIANGCTDATAEIADAWGERTVASARNVGYNVLELADGHKIRALNAGIRQTENDLTIVMDADVTLDELALDSLVQRLCTDQPVGASLYHAADPDHLPQGPLRTVIQMADLRRQAIPERYKLHGAFMGWNHHALAQDGGVSFPEYEPVSDDTWLSFKLAHMHGMDAVQSTNNGVFSRYIPPQTVEDYVRQHSRYAVADEMVKQYFPEFGPVVSQAHQLLPPEECTTMAWRQLCAQNGIDFDAGITTYRAVRAEIAKKEQTAILELIAGNGQWELVETARITADDTASRPALSHSLA